MKNTQLRFKSLSHKIVLAALASSLLATPVLYANTLTTTAVTAAVTEAVTITETQGWLESASVKWLPVAQATGYNVYCSSDGVNFTQLDTELIRQYDSYMRADALGLAEGNYILKVVPIINGTEAVNKAAVTETVAVKAHTREGFAFSASSTMGTGSGGYNDDGTVAKNAQILYVTADNINTITADVISNSKGAKTTCTGLVDILSKRQKAYDKNPLIIRMIGTIKASDIKGLNSSGYIQIKGSYNTTFEGVGEDATINGWGLLIRDSRNVEIRNVGVMLFPDDGISLDTDNENIWVHNNDIFYGTAGSDADQAKGDGSCDVKGKSTYVTVAFNHFYDSGKCSLCGMSDSEEFFVTYHHNWFDHSDSRHPRIRVGSIHIYNNYFDGNSKYGVGVTKGSSAFVEANAFRNCKYPMLSSLQGSDIAGGSVGTFSKEAGGMIKAYNNKIEGASGLVYAQDNAKQFDAYLATSQDEKVPATYKTVSGGTTYNNFDTAASMYAYTPDAPENVAQIVTAYAGRTNGGDFSWTFTAADDTSYKLNANLMAALKNYDSKLVSIGGGSVVTPEVTPDTTPEVTPEVTPDPTPEVTPEVTPDATPEVTPEVTPDATPEVTPEVTPDTTPDTTPVEGQVTHNFTTQGLTSDYFNFVGNLSDDKGTVSYAGLTLSQCLKLETSTTIQFTTDQATTLTLAINDADKKVCIDGTKVKAVDGVVTVDIAAGDHVITKGDSTELFYIGLN